jgi:hypothetical protein
VVLGKHERGRLKRIERRCDWLEARVSILHSEGVDAAYDLAELSALKWALELIRTHCGETVETVDWVKENRALQNRIAQQRRVIRNLVAYLHRIPLNDNELDAIVDAANQKESPELTDAASPTLDSGKAAG